MNLNIFQFIFSLSGWSPWLDGLGVFLAVYLPWILVIGFIWFLYRQSGWRRKLFLLAEGLLATILARGLIVEMVRFFFPQPRPFEVLPIDALITETAAAFPSGHASFYFALAIVLYFADKKWGWVYIAFATINGLSRIFVGVHWPADIVAGAFVGILSAIVIHRLLIPYSHQFSMMGKAESSNVRPHLSNEQRKR